MGATTNLHVNSGWSKTNDNFDGILKALGREQQGCSIGTGGTDGPPAAASANITASSSDSGLDPDWWGGGVEEAHEEVE